MPKRAASGSPSSTKQLARNRPTRGADQNQRLLGNGATKTSDDLLLPSLEDGITLLDIDGSRGVPILHSLVLDHLLTSDGPAFWVDAEGYATTTSLARLTPSQRLLNRIHVARGFTAYQHYGALCDLSNAVTQYVQQTDINERSSTQERSDRDQETSPYTPSLIVAPALDAQYRTDDTLGEANADALQTRTLARLRHYADGYDVPVLVTRTVDDEFTAPLETVADHYLECEQTKMGPRFVGDEFETLVYPVDGGSYYQTTFAYWRQLLGARAAQVGLQPASPPRPTPPDESVGSGTMADGTTATLTANPLLDAFENTAGAGGR